MIPLQYLLSSQLQDDLLPTLDEVLTAGCRWVHLQLTATSTSATDDRLLQQVAQRCQAAEATLIVEGAWEAALLHPISGVCIDSVATLREARKSIGDELLLTVRVDNATDAINALKNGADFLLFTAPVATHTEELHQVAERLAEKEMYAPLVALGDFDLPQIPVLLDAGAQAFALPHRPQAALSAHVRAWLEADADF